MCRQGDKVETQYTLSDGVTKIGDPVGSIADGKLVTADKCCYDGAKEFLANNA